MTGQTARDRRHGRAGALAYVWGYNNTGELGIGHAARVFRPAPVRFQQRYVDLQGGANFTVALTSSGQVWTWGGNEHGQLGDGSRTARTEPKLVRLPRGAVTKAISAGTDHVLVLTTDGAVIGWGRNTCGQLGLGDTDDRLSPRRVELGSIRQVATGDGVSAAVDTTGRLFVWGRNSFGQLPVKSSAGSPARQVLRPARATVAARVAAVDAGLRHVVVLTADGDVLAYGTDAAGTALARRVALPTGSGRVRSISAGEDYTLALTSRGLVVAWGGNDLGQVGVGTLERSHRAPAVVRLPGARGRVVAIRAGHRHGLALTDRREVFAWGDGRYGAVGAGRPKPDAAAVATAQRVPVPDGAITTGLGGGGYSSAVFVERGPATGLTLAPSDATTVAGETVRYRVHVVDAFGTDLGPVSGRVSLTVPGATVHGTTVTAHQPGSYSVSARAGSLLGRATLHAMKDNHR